jgi:prepilin-type N-terminal cleavage/methylation domain-containing protein
MKQPRGHGNQIVLRGFTLLELVVVLVIMVVFSLVLGVMTLSALDAMATINTQGGLQQQLDITTYTVTSDVHLSTGQPTVSADSRTLTLQLPPINGQGQVVQGAADTITYTFDQIQGTLQRTVTPSADSLRQAQNSTIARNLAAVAFSVSPVGQSPADVRMDLTGTRQERQVVSTLILTSQATVRN